MGGIENLPIRNLQQIPAHMRRNLFTNLPDKWKLEAFRKFYEKTGYHLNDFEKWSDFKVCKSPKITNIKLNNTQHKVIVMDILTEIETLAKPENIPLSLWRMTGQMYPKISFEARTQLIQEKMKQNNIEGLQPDNYDIVNRSFSSIEDFLSSRASTIPNRLSTTPTQEEEKRVNANTRNVKLTIPPRDAVTTHRSPPPSPFPPSRNEVNEETQEDRDARMRGSAHKANSPTSSPTHLEISMAVTRTLRTRNPRRTYTPENQDRPRSPRLIGDFVEEAVLVTPSVNSKITTQPLVEEIPAMPAHFNLAYAEGLRSLQSEERNNCLMEVELHPMGRLLEKRRRWNDPLPDTEENQSGATTKQAKDNDGFIIPKKSSKWSEMIKQRCEIKPVETANRFNPISDQAQPGPSGTSGIKETRPTPPISSSCSSSEDEEEQVLITKSNPKKNKANKNNKTQKLNKNNPKTKQNNTNQPKKNQKPPPIVIQGIITDRRRFLEEIRSIAEKTVFFKYGHNSTLLYAENEEDYVKLRDKFKTESVPFHTYTQRKDKSHAFVVRGLDFEPEASEVTTDLLEQHQIVAKEVFRLRTRALRDLNTRIAASNKNPMDILMIFQEFAENIASYRINN
ncbi:unnamed protein product [Phaedon cochleariae]|uniref:Uncharacterized protein n=1 Tax=Phaedon cochleariae TaxID=80249 RepID=A0A9N9SA81_PHACE|nr:unnamed protein product [Phaedon cochleariae]